MKLHVRYVLIFLLMLLPLQFSWAAMAAYCSHETASSTSHVGHHQSTDATKADQPGQQDQSAAGKLAGDNDADCGVCHFSCVKPVGVQPTRLPVASAENSFLRALATRYLSHIGDTPEEPDWMLVA